MNLPQSLKRAIRDNDTERAADELAKLTGAVDDYAVHSMPLVVWAGAVGRPQVVKQLIDAGANPAKYDNALHQVIFSGSHMSSWEEARDVSALGHLIDAGCDPNGVNESGESPLFSAGLAAVHPERAEAAARLLLANGADLSRPENHGLLHRTVCTPASGMVAALMEAGADPNELNKGGATPAMSCVMELNRAFARSHDNPDDDSDEVAAEFVAENLRLLIEHGADVSESSPDEVNPLQIVFATEGSPESIKTMLLDAGAPADATIGVNGQNVDYLAISLLEGHSPEFVVRLYDAGCPLDAKYDVMGGGSFIRLAPQYAPELVLELCRHSETVLETVTNYVTEKDFSLLSAALAGGNRELVQLLLDQGLSPEQTNPEGQSMRDYIAGFDGGEEALELLDELLS